MDGIHVKNYLTSVKIKQKDNEKPEEIIKNDEEDEGDEEEDKKTSEKLKLEKLTKGDKN